ncbi:hypothetical protein L6164_004497 [Bauhinia variegata]|uniref:Uncharacterized protein n=1 Tax=Bauhinia variegata TaxID=167791 RepID=A0ACB9Q3Q9_BAUVA|nr:hypothetical protein L6164_004497 [Bauhinia variegata]
MEQPREQKPGEATTDRSASIRLREKKVKDLTVDKKRLVEVPYTASLAHTMNSLVANKVVAVPVAAPPGQWIGAGGSMIVEADKHTRAVRKHYIGMVTMLDIVAHIAGDEQMNGGDDGTEDLDRKMSVPVSSIIGHSLEGLSLWTLNPNTSLMDCMEVFSKGVHRAMVPVDSQLENVSAGGVELIESASSYRMLTQMDVIKFLKEHANELKGNILAQSIQESGAISEQIYAITDRTTLIDAIRCLRVAMLNAVPIVWANETIDTDHKQLINAKGRKVIGTFSATDLRGCYLATLKSWLPVSALTFTEETSTSPLYTGSTSIHDTTGASRRELVTCGAESPLYAVIDKAVTKHVHRVWVVDEQGLLLGLVSLTDVIRVIRHSLLSESSTI